MYEITAAVIAILVVGGAIVITILNQITRNSSIATPDWLQVAVGAVIGFYFARRSNAQARLNYLAAVEANGAHAEQNGG